MTLTTRPTKTTTAPATRVDFDRLAAGLSSATRILPAGSPEAEAVAQAHALLMPDALITTGDAATLLGVRSINTVKNWLEAGWIAGAVRTPRGRWLLPAREVARLAAARDEARARNAEGLLLPRMSASLSEDEYPDL